MISPGLTSNNTNDWWTPPHILDRVRQAIGGIDLDPCAPSDCPHHTGAREWFTADDDGLSRPWAGRIYMNPPYGTAVPKWIAKAIAEVEEGGAEVVIACVAARTDTRWFLPLFRYPIAFITGRVKFLDGTGVQNLSAAPFPTAIVSIRRAHTPDQIARFTEAFSPIGTVMSATGVA